MGQEVRVWVEYLSLLIETQALTFHSLPSPHRQRYQYKLKHQMGKHSTLSDDREQALNNAGFIWDSHQACWQERFQALEAFALLHGHCNVPHNYHDPSLSVWCKHQRRQWKRQQKGQSSTMTEERFQFLKSIGFDWNPRNLKS